jgi:nitric oxide reductase large subunit
VFQRNGLMNHGTVLGNGAYFGNDLPADALESKTECVRAFYAEQRYGEPYADLTAPERAAVDERAREDLRSRSDSPEDGALTYSAAGAYAHEQVREDYVARYHEGNESLGLAIMVGASLLPIGFRQLETAFTAGYDTARSLAFYERPLVQTFFWLRFPGDTLLIAGTAIFFGDALATVRRLRSVTPSDEAGPGALATDGPGESPADDGSEATASGSAGSAGEGNG